MSLVAGLTLRLQRWAAAGSYAWHSRGSRGTDLSWVVGPDEFATMLTSVGAAIADSYTVCLTRHPYYSVKYDYEGAPNVRIGVLRMIAEGWAFGQQVARSRGFIYLGPNGFLRAQADARAFEYAFLKQRGKKICSIFVGSDIRAPRVMALQESELDVPNIATYLTAMSPVFGTDAYDQQRKALAGVADSYSDLIFSMSKDQAGYLTSETLPFMYFYPEDCIVSTLEKFNEPEKLIVLHAPSSPVIKGTQLVRAAVAKLQSEGYDFEYVELSGVAHEEVTAQLQRAHIVLNQFYAYVPGVFGVEAMGAGTVLLQSADETLEPDLPAGSNDAWVVTKHHEVVEKLRAVLQMTPTELRKQADAGRDWVRSNATSSISGRKLRELLGE